MNNDLKDFLFEKGYVRVKLKQTKTNHLEVKAKLNGISGRFILDTGASSTCIGFDTIEYFKVNAEDSQVKAAGAGAIDMLTQSSFKNSIEIGTWTYKKLDLVLFDLTHVNTALVNHNSTKVDGIIGADI